MLRILPLLLAATSLLSVTGCVERMMQIRSEPTGAQVFLDGRHIGATPVTVAFDFYGTREVMVRMEETTRRGERSLAPQV
ncbi:MAG TPA: PEGA domain-containing protein, partial [Planctomycetes bacterium]|nr:PEGA domain-containing protein [Planctomycetota bacterium]